jgi:hypothetical protein
LIAVQGLATWHLRSGRRRNASRTILAAANQSPANVLGPILEPVATASD